MPIMMTDSYHLLKPKEESIRIFNQRLLLFAIAYRIERASHSIYVADQIIKRELVEQFMAFQPAIS
ncbi:hypothetical protein GCM10028806_24130 [Spirosoma terrae]